MNNDTAVDKVFLDSIRGMGALGLWQDSRLRLTPPALGAQSSAARFLLVEEWLWQTTAGLEVVSEVGFRDWLGATLALEAAEDSRLRELRRRAAEEFLGYFEATEPRADRYASFPYLVAASSFWSRDELKTYSFFSSFSGLDAGLGRATAGLFAVLMSQAVKEQPFRAGFGAWFFNTLGRVLRELRGAPKQLPRREDLGDLEQIETRVVEGYEAGAKAAPAGADLEKRSADGAVEAEGLGAVEPLDLWFRLSEFLHREASTFPESLAKPDPRSPVDRRTAQVSSILAGAWYGFRALEERLGEELRSAETGARASLGLDFRLRGEMLLERSLLLPLALEAERTLVEAGKGPRQPAPVRGSDDPKEATGALQ